MTQVDATGADSLPSPVMFGPIRRLLEGEESRLNVASGLASVSVYSQAAYASPAYGRTQLSRAPYLLSSRPYATEEKLSASRAQQAEASPPREEDEEEEEKEEEEGEEG